MGKSGVVVNIVGNSFDEKNVKKYQKQPEKMLKAGEFINLKWYNTKWLNAIYPSL